MGWDLLGLHPVARVLRHRSCDGQVYAVAGLVGRDAGRVGEFFEGLFELASILLMLAILATTVAVIVAGWIYVDWWAALAFLSLPLFLGWGMVSAWLDDPLGF